MKADRYLWAVLLCAGWLAAPAHALRQVNWAQEAGDVINHMPDMYSNEYPWLSGDGKLLLWTRQVKSEACAPGQNGCQRVWVAYVKNWREIADAPANNGALPELEVSQPMPLTKVNELVAGNITIKSIAVCEEGTQPREYSNRWRYRFSLYMSTGTPGGTKSMHRAHRVFVVVNKASMEITSMGRSGGYSPVIPPATRPNGGVANETEPMLTRDGRYLFWASNAFNGGNVARYIGPVASCTQVNQTPRSYATLPSNLFPWKDQYSQGFTETRTGKSNYHTVVERPNGVSALIFETCSGQVDCAAGGSDNRDCRCKEQKKKLSTTGFADGNDVGPTLITNCCGSRALNRSGVRLTHPATSPRHANGTWTLFYMRGKKIWYTKIME